MSILQLVFFGIRLDGLVNWRWAVSCNAFTGLIVVVCCAMAGCLNPNMDFVGRILYWSACVWISIGSLTCDSGEPSGDQEEKTP